MKKIIITTLMLGAAMTATGAKAHDFSARFDTRAQCETAYADSNKIDRDFLRDFRPDLFQTKGDVMRYLTQYVRCEYDPVEDEWYFEDNRPGF